MFAALEATATVVFPRAKHGVAIMSVPRIAAAAVFAPVLCKDRKRTDSY